MPAPFDRRTRRDADIRALDPATFFAEDLPPLLAGRGPMAAAGLEALGAPPLAVEVEVEGEGGGAWSLVAEGGTVAVRSGVVDGAVVVTFDTATFSDWAQLQASLNGLSVAQVLRYRDGTERDVSIWDSLWLTIQDGWPIVDPDLAFLDRDGRPLDLGRSFTRDDDPADVAHFLREAGYLHLRGWLDPTDMATISADIDRAQGEYTEGDGRSWWAELADGSHRVVRLQDFLPYSPTTAAILDGPVWEQLRVTLAGDDAELVKGKAIEALIKPVGVVRGASDVTFHRDCHLGRHPYGCSGATIGISVTGSSEANGRLRVCAGSHRVVMPVEIAKHDPYLPVVAVTTEPGDLTVHLSCTLHEARPPVTEARKVMYAGFSQVPRADEGDPKASAGSKALSDLREKAPKLLLGASAPSAKDAWADAPPDA